MRIVVTGASGRVGRYLLRELGAEHDVRAFDLRPLADPKVTFVGGDITNLEDCKRAIDGAEVVIHLAAIPNPLSDPPERVMLVNAMGTFNVLEAATSAGVRRVVTASTDSALGFVFRKRDFLPEYLPIDEAHPLKPQDPYGLSKLIGEETCKSYTRGYGLETVCVRICRVLFPEDAELNARLASEPTILAKGLWVYVDVRDAARAFRLAAERPGLGHEALFAAAPDVCAREETASLLERFYPALLPWVDRVPGHSSLITGAKARQTLDFVPRFTWRDLVGGR
jgi:nucleoside-diphosphate-sugar epimerase